MLDSIIKPDRCNPVNSPKRDFVCGFLQGSFQSRLAAHAAAQPATLPGTPRSTREVSGGVVYHVPNRAVARSAFLLMDDRRSESPSPATKLLDDLNHGNCSVWPQPFSVASDTDATADGSTSLLTLPPHRSLRRTDRLLTHSHCCESRSCRYLQGRNDSAA